MKILHLISSPRGEASFSVKLGNAIVEQLEQAYPNSTVIRHDLTIKPLPHLEVVHLQSFYTPVEDRSPELQQAVVHSDTAIAELFDADIIVIGAPFYNFGIPSTLKTWLDHITRKGISFTYSENGPQGLISGKKVYIAASSGGIYSEGAMSSYDFSVPYLKLILGVLGMTDTTVFRIEGTSLPGNEAAAVEKGLNSIRIEKEVTV
jgi:FMN-dependent NADH-azoreductase